MPTSDAATKLRGVPQRLRGGGGQAPGRPAQGAERASRWVYVSGIANARSLRFGGQGHAVREQPRARQGYAVVDKDGKRERRSSPPAWTAERASSSTTARSTSRRHQDFKLEKIEDNLDNPPKPSSIYSDFPNHQSQRLEIHGARAGHKSTSMSARLQHLHPARDHGQIRRINLDGSGAEVVARGVRNSVGFDWHP